MTIKFVFTPQSRLAGSPLEVLRRESFETHKRNGDGVAISVYHNHQRLRLSGTDRVRNRLMHWFDVGQDKTGGLPSCQRKASRSATGNKNLRPAEQGLLVAPSLNFQSFTTIDSFEDEREKKELDRKRGKRATKKKAGTWK